MKKVVFNNVDYVGDTLYVAQNSITLLLNGSVVFEAKNIEDFSTYVIEGEPDITLEQEIEQFKSHTQLIRQALDELLLGGM